MLCSHNCDESPMFVACCNRMDVICYNVTIGCISYREYDKIGVVLKGIGISEKGILFGKDYIVGRGFCVVNVF